FYQLCRVGPYASRVTAGPAIIDAYVAAFYPSQLLKPLLQCFDPNLSFCIVRDTHEHANAPHPPGLLRARCQRQCDSRAAEQRDELAPPHSITSSAATSSLSGTVRPSILAVEALMTSSNLLDCTTGKSAALAPLSIRPVYTPMWRYASTRLAP